MEFEAKELIAHLSNQLNQTFNTQYTARERNTMLLWLTEHFLGISKVDILLNKKVFLTKEQNQTLAGAIQRLNEDEPIQYILGEAEFYGRPFMVNPHVLIPRQETEELVDYIIQDYANTPDLRVLDIGTGSGCIAVTLAKELHNAQVYAIDSSLDALHVATENASALGAEVRFIQLDILKESPSVGMFDIVVSNPPYVLKSEAVAIRRNVLLHEPHTALFVDDTSPLLFYQRISELCNEILAIEGQVWFEINEMYASQVTAMLRDHHFSDIVVKRDMLTKDRFVMAKRKV